MNEFWVGFCVSWLVAVVAFKIVHGIDERATKEHYEGRIKTARASARKESRENEAAFVLETSDDGLSENRTH